MAFHLENPFGQNILGQEDFIVLFEAEEQYMPLERYGGDEIIASRREEAMTLIDETDAVELTKYLAVSYLDFLLSRVKGMIDDLYLKKMVEICLYLAHYMKSNQVEMDWLEDREKGNLNPLELGIEMICALRCRLRHVTSICFVSYFINFLALTEDNIKRCDVYSFICEIQHDIIKSTTYKPSINAACAVLATLSDGDRNEYFRTVASCEFIKEEDLRQCFILVEHKDHNKEVMGKQKMPIITLEFTGVVGQYEHNRRRADAEEGYDLEYPLGRKQNSDGIETLFHVETDYMPAEGYWRNKIANSHRRTFISFIRQYSPDVYSQIRFLSVAYFDYYFSRNPELDPSSRFLKVCALSCLSLASTIKARPFVLNKYMLGRVRKSEIEHRTRVIGSALGGRLRPVTAFGFVDYFISLLKLDTDSGKRAKALAILYFGEDMHLDVITFAKYKPSIHAASAILYYFRGQEKYEEFVEAIGSNRFVNKGELDECIHCSISVVINEKDAAAAASDNPAAPRPHPEIMGFREPQSAVAAADNPAAPRPPGEVMAFIREKGGIEVKLVIAKSLTASDVSKKESRFLIPRNQVKEESFITKDEENALAMSTEAKMEDVPLLQPNLEVTEVNLKLRKKTAYVLCRKWTQVVNRNKLTEGKKLF